MGKTETKPLPIKVTESQKKAVALLTRPSLQFAPKSAETLAAEAASERARVIANLEAGDPMPDGSIFVGLTADGSQQIYAMPTDLDVTMTFNNAAKRIEKLNAEKSLGHDDWQIPSLENLRVLQKNQTEGSLKDTFKTVAASGSFSPDWYWSSTESRDYPSYVHVVRFSDDLESWHHTGYVRLSCRPVRLVAASAPAPAPGSN